MTFKKPLNTWSLKKIKGVEILCINILEQNRLQKIYLPWWLSIHSKILSIVLFCHCNLSCITSCKSLSHARNNKFCNPIKIYRNCGLTKLHTIYHNLDCSFCSVLQLPVVQREFLKMDVLWKCSCVYVRIVYLMKASNRIGLPCAASKDEMQKKC